MAERMTDAELRAAIADCDTGADGQITADRERGTRCCRWWGPMPEPTALQRAIADTIEWARAHALGAQIDPADFAIQRSEPGVTVATHLGAEYAVTVVVDRHGNTRRAIAELDWIHNERDPDRPKCTVCEPCSVCNPWPCECERPTVDVHLPGDETGVPNA